MNTAQTHIERKRDVTDRLPTASGFVGDRLGTDPLYHQMCKARMAFMAAYQAWLIEAQPSAQDAEEDTQGTASALRQWNHLLLQQETF